MGLLNHASYRIQPNRLRAVRLKAGLTQTELAFAAGYTPRLIRKVESIGRVSGAALKDIVQAICERGVLVAIDDLLFDELGICRRFIECYERFGAEVFDYSSELFSKQFTFSCTGGDGNPLFLHQGNLDDYRVWLQQYFAWFTGPFENQIDPRYLVDGHAITVRRRKCFAVKG